MKMLPQNRFNLLADKEQQVVTAFVDKLQQRYDDQLVCIILFGSRARGEARPDSDMDLLVVMSGVAPDIRREVRYLAVEVWLEYGIYPSTRVWSQTYWRKLRKLQTQFYRNIQQDGINLLELSPSF